MPLAMQNLIQTSVNFVDTIMIGQLGEISIAAVGLSNQFFFLYNLLVFGLVSGGSIFIAQYWGKKEVNNISRITAIMLVFSSAAGVLFFILGLFFSSQILRIFTPDPLVIMEGIPYLQAVSFTFFTFAISAVFFTVLRSTEKAVTALIISLISMSTNVFEQLGKIM